MDQETLVSLQSESGRQLIAALVPHGFDVLVAFWAKPTDDGKWFLYLASRVVDDKGPAAAYRLVHGILRKSPDLYIDPLEIKLIGSNDSLARAALELTNQQQYRGMTRYYGSSLGGVSIDGAYIYPPSQPATLT
jgi:hypothetical protein